MTTMAELLERWNSDVLQKYVAMLGGGAKITRKAERIEFICRKMTDPASLAEIWRGMDDLARRAVSNAYHNGGIYNQMAFVAQYGEPPPRPKKGNEYWYSYYHREPIPFDLFVIEGQVPDELMPLLGDLALPPDRFRLEGAAELPAAEPPRAHDPWREALVLEQVHTELIGRTDLLTFLRMVEQGQLSFSSTNSRLTAGSMRKLLEQLVAGDFAPPPEKVTSRNVIRPVGLDVFTHEAGLVTHRGGLTEAGRSYLHEQKPETFLAAFEKWAGSGSFDELSRITGLKGLRSSNTYLTPAASRRERVIEALSWCPVNVWIDIAEFYRALIIWDFDFEVESGAYRNLYIGPSRYYGEMGADDYWTVTHGLYINAVIWEYLGTIGAVDLAFADRYAVAADVAYDLLDEPLSPYDGLRYFRINNWGAYLLGQADAYQAPEPERKALFVVDEERRVRVTGELLPSDRMLLAAVTETAGAPGTHLLTTEKLLTAVEEGQELDRLIAFLEAGNAGALPAAVAGWLAELKRNQGAVKESGRAVLLQIRRRDLLETIVQDEVLGSLSRKLDDKTLIVAAGSMSRFRARLKSLGYLVR